MFKTLVALVLLGFGLMSPTDPGWCSDTTAPDTVEEPPDGSRAALTALTLEEALARALKRSPKLAVFSREIRARDFEALQAGYRPNPELSLEVENVAGSGEFSGTESAETTLRVSQLFELGDKRKKRQEVARLGRQMAEREYELVRAEVLAETRERFVAVLAAQMNLALAEEQIALTAKVLQTVEDRIEAGKSAAMEKIRFRALVSEARLRREKARQEMRAARQALSAAWGSEEIDFETVRGRLEEGPLLPKWSDLVATLGQSPEVALRESATGHADRVLALEKAKRIPDLTFSLGAKNERDTGDNALVAEVSIPLPIFDRNQGALGAARARLSKAREAKRAVQLQLRTELSGAWQRLHSAREEVVMLREEILPDTRETFDAVTYGYRAGKFGFLEVLDAERTLFDARSRYVDALKNYHRAVADLERLLGREIYSAANSAADNEKERGQS